MHCNVVYHPIGSIAEMILPLSTALLLSCGLALIISWGWKMADLLWMRPKKLERILRLQGLSGNHYHFLFGDLRESSLMSKEAKSRPITLSDDPKPRFLPFVHHSIEKFGKDSFMWIGPTPRVNVTSPQLLKDIFLRIGEFQKSSPPPLVKLLAQGLATLEGDKWAMHRKIINPAFHVKKLKLMLPAFHSSITEMICQWEKLASAGQGYCTINVWPELQNLTRDVISRTAFGSSFQEGRRIFELQNELVKLVLENIQTIFIPGWRFVPTKTNQRMKSIDREVQMLLRGMIQRREKAMQTEEAPADDLLGLLLKSNMEQIQQEDGKNKKMGMGMNICDVMEECKLFYFAGQETTSVLLAWTMVLLGAYPEWQEKAREEVLKIFGSNKPDFDQLNHLKIVTMILYEVMRLYPPVTSLSREVYKETKLGSLTLPAGVQLALPMALVHRDPKLWGEDAEEFKPERFGEGISKATQNQVTYFPFAWGPRICIGQNFAMIEAKMALAMILQCFTFELSPTYVHAPTTVITLHPQHGVQVVLRRR